MTLKVDQIKADLKSCSLSAKANFHPASKLKSEPLSFCSFSSSFQILFSPVPGVLHHDHIVKLLQVGVEVQLDVVHGGIEGEVVRDVSPERQQALRVGLCKGRPPQLSDP